MTFDPEVAGPTWKTNGSGTDAQLWQCSFEPDGPVEDGALLLAERAIGAKKEIFHLYNANSSAMLWMVYGFLEDPRGGHEEIEEDGDDVAVDVVCDVDVDVVDVVDDVG